MFYPLLNVADPERVDETWATRLVSGMTVAEMRGWRRECSVRLLSGHPLRYGYQPRERELLDAEPYTEMIASRRREADDCCRRTHDGLTR
jgi:hypothetical protein